ncbi:MAG: lysophospholipid acyltransferase family protein [Verrucomicrobiota bacterium]
MTHLSMTPLRPGKSSRVVVPNQANLLQRAGAFLVYSAVRAVAATLRWNIGDGREWSGNLAKGPVIFCIWHNRLALSLILYERYVQRQYPDRQMAGMVSASKDGALLARIMELFGAQPVRGSTSRRGPQALLELTSWAERGYDLAITPDGPRGPCYEVQDGILAVAQLTGLPIMPVAYRLKGKIKLRSWDRFQIPLPLARCDIAFAEPLVVPREISDAQRDTLRQQLKARMDAITRD